MRIIILANLDVEFSALGFFHKVNNHIVRNLRCFDVYMAKSALFIDKKPLNYSILYL